MSKKIRVGWDDLKPGDLIHVKGSTNTYRFKSRTDWHSIIKVEGDGVGVSATWKLGVEKEPVSVFLVVYEEDFAYATRPAPKKKPRPSIVEPILPANTGRASALGHKPVGDGSSNGMLPAVIIGCSDTMTRHRIKHFGAGPWRVFIRG